MPVSCTLIHKREVFEESTCYHYLASYQPGYLMFVHLSSHLHFPRVHLTLHNSFHSCESSIMKTLILLITIPTFVTAALCVSMRDSSCQGQSWLHPNKKDPAHDLAKSSLPLASPLTSVSPHRQATSVCESAGSKSLNVLLTG